MSAAQPVSLLAAEAVAVGYAGSAPVLAGVDLALDAGEIVAVLGASGSGKSSLLRVLAGLQAPSGGRVTMRGQPIAGVHPRLAVAFQDPSLLPWLTLEKNVAFGLDFRSQPTLSRAERQARVDAAIEEVGLGHARRRKPAELSGGMAQRTALARCLARQPDVLLLDEPFGALDEVTRADMQQLLLRVRDDVGAAALLVTHDIDEALLVADRIVLLGGHPAHVIGRWRIDTPQPRADRIQELGALRIEILQQLRRAMRPGADPSPEIPAHSLSREGNVDAHRSTVTS
ncbi:ABC transporter ATP-binding protein [Bordetella genomosp. 1]|uniref:ABC transporter ATP-binding protein n=1 Tax=Bordetella genomosp. 1 TaxID=1395607 RepID=A0ABX4F040_9BORD|nr:ABC transporter ATP-binding protein [Bordetella genomosp. 1]MDQ8033306.1 ABC transporter ATP-binding protein [Bordetella sp.]OZI65034.1 ABC transporter ATP-binding protein [Bordetella genomosp. 1]